MLNLIKSTWQDFYQHPFRPIYLKILLPINLLGSLAGFLWYQNQLSATPWHLWPFVPDSPLSSSLFTLMLLLILLKKSHSMLELVACLGMIKYGIWAVFVLTSHWFTGGHIFAIDIALWLSHLGMALEGGIYLRQVGYSALEGKLAWLWMLINDFMDYQVGVHPYLPNSQLWLMVMWFTLFLTTLLGIIVNRKRVKVTRQPSY